MRRSVATIVGTLAGTAMLVGAKFGVHPTAAADSLGPVDPGAPTSAAPSPPGQPTTGVATPRRSAGVKPSPTRAAPTTTKATGGLKDGSFTGAGAWERYGTITVTITVSGGRLSGATATCSGCGETSQSISNDAFPTLKQEALAAQSARIATVSGATYTSGAYRASLQSALDAARA
jgi:uncharacterized protein with FMN-binding domain